MVASCVRHFTLPLDKMIKLYLLNIQQERYSKLEYYSYILQIAMEDSYSPQPNKNEPLEVPDQAVEHTTHHTNLFKNPKDRKESDETEVDTLTKQKQDKEFRRQHRNYINERIQRRKEMRAKKEEIFGASSDSDDEWASPPTVAMEKVETKIKLESISEKSGSLMKTQLQKPNQKFKIVLPNKKGKIIEESTLEFTKYGITLNEKQYPFAKITKIKVYSKHLGDDYYQIKITVKDNSEDQIFFGVSVQNKQKVKDLTAFYHVFSKIVLNKIQQQGFKFKPYAESQMIGLNPQYLKTSKITGKLLKKSKVMHKWEERIVSIGSQGFYSFRKSSQKPTNSMQMGDVKELWTRFENESELLVIKLLHKGNKIQFAVPANDFASKQNWLFHFSTLLFREG